MAAIETPRSGGRNDLREFLTTRRAKITPEQEAGRDPYSKDLTALIGELSTRSEDFRRRWAAHDVRYHRTGRKRLHHPLVGDVELDYEAFDLVGDPGQRLNVYTAPPDTTSEEALTLLASWTATGPATGTSPALTVRDDTKPEPGVQTTRPHGVQVSPLGLGAMMFASATEP